jgi:hypothetical protein
MRTTLDIDDDLLLVARQIAAERGLSMGQVISELTREALTPRRAAKTRNGVPLFTPRSGAKKPHLKLVNTLRDGA